MHHETLLNQKYKHPRKCCFLRWQANVYFFNPGTVAKTEVSFIPAASYWLRSIPVILKLIMWIYIHLECPPAKTRLLKRTETVTIYIILIIGFLKKKLDVQLEKNLLLRFDPSKAKIFWLMFRMEISEYEHIIQLFKGGGEQNRPFQISRTSYPSIWGRIYKD